MLSTDNNLPDSPGPPPPDININNFQQQSSSLQTSQTPVSSEATFDYDLGTVPNGSYCIQFVNGKFTYLPMPPADTISQLQQAIPHAASTSSSSSGSLITTSDTEILQ